MSFPLPKNRRKIFIDKSDNTFYDNLGHALNIADEFPGRWIVVQSEKQYPDIGPGIATGYPRSQVVGDQVVGAGRDDQKKPYPVNPTPMQGPGDNPSAQPVLPKLQSFVPTPEQAQEGIDQQRLLTENDYANLVTGQKLKSPMTERVLNALKLADEALADEGGAGSGYHGHSGRVGERGGSAPSGASRTDGKPDNFILYHVTTRENADSILREGFIAGKSSPLGQSFEPEYKGAYGFVSPDQASMNIDRSIEDNGLKPSDLAILKISVPTKDFEDRLRPDEDWSLNASDWPKYQQEGSGVIIGNVPKEYIQEVPYISTDAQDLSKPPPKSEEEGGILRRLKAECKVRSEALYTTTPNGLQEEADITQVGQVPELDRHGSTIFLDPSFDGSHANNMRNIGEHWDMIDRVLKSAGFIEKQRIAGVSRYNYPITDDMCEVKATDNSGTLHVIFTDRLDQPKADLTNFNSLKEYLETWYVPRQIYARNLKAKRGIHDV